MGLWKKLSRKCRPTYSTPPQRAAKSPPPPNPTFLTQKKAASSLTLRLPMQIYFAATLHRLLSCGRSSETQWEKVASSWLLLSSVPPAATKPIMEGEGGGKRDGHHLKTLSAAGVKVSVVAAEVPGK